MTYEPGSTDVPMHSCGPLYVALHRHGRGRHVQTEEMIEVLPPYRRGWGVYIRLLRVGVSFGVCHRLVVDGELGVPSELVQYIDAPVAEIREWVPWVRDEELLDESEEPALRDELAEA